jgi:hypothetical protein
MDLPSRFGSLDRSPCVRPMRWLSLDEQGVILKIRKNNIRISDIESRPLMSERQTRARPSLLAALLRGPVENEA